MKAFLHIAGLVYESEPAFPVSCIPVNLSQVPWHKASEVQCVYFTLSENFSMRHYWTSF